MTDPLAEARAVVDSSLQSLMLAGRRLGEYHSDGTTDSAWVAFKEAKALTDVCARAVLDEAHAGHLAEDALSLCRCLELRARLGGEKGAG